MRCRCGKDDSIDIRGRTIKIRSRAVIFASVAAQVVAGFASILLTIAVARTQTADSLGVFAVTLAVQGLLLGTTRSFTADVFLFSRESYAPDTARPMLIGSATAVLIIASLFSIVALLAAICAHQILSSSLIQSVLFGVALLLLPTSLQQHLRTALVAARRHFAALLLDCLALSAVIGGAVFVTNSEPTVMGYLSVWAAASGIHAAGAIVIFRLRMRLGMGFTWLRSRWRGGLTFATDFGVTAGLAQFVILFVSAVSGIGSAGALKAAQTLVMPVTLVMRGTGGPVATVLVRRVAVGARVEAVRICIVFSAFCFVSALACGIWLLVPEEYLVLLLGESAAAAKAIVLPTALALGAMGIATGAGYFLRANGELRVATTLKLLCFPVSLAAVTWGTLVAAAAGAQVGLMVGELTRSVLAWGAVRRRF